MNYKEAEKLLQGRNHDSRKLCNNTYLIRDFLKPEQETVFHIKLHRTNILTYYANGDIGFDSGGWKTVTTKQRMNEFVRGIRIYANKGVWYVHKYPLANDANASNEWKLENDVVFEDGMMLHADGSISGYGENPKALLALKRKVQNYARKFIEAMKAGKIVPPSQGDCLGCQFSDKTRIVSGEAPKNPFEHIQSHIEENYFVPTLLVNAVNWRGSQMNRWVIESVWYPNDLKDSAAFHSSQTWQWKEIQKNLTRYLYRELGLPS